MWLETLEILRILAVSFEFFFVLFTVPKIAPRIVPSVMKICQIMIHNSSLNMIPNPVLDVLKDMKNSMKNLGLRKSSGDIISEANAQII
jgi:hypothetical protein